jgi:hypothetical protein
MLRNGFEELIRGGKLNFAGVFGIAGFAELTTKRYSSDDTDSTILLVV